MKMEIICCYVIIRSCTCYSPLAGAVLRVEVSPGHCFPSLQFSILNMATADGGAYRQVTLNQ